MLPTTHPDFFLDEAWLVKPARNQLQAGDTVTSLEPKVMQVLLCLAEVPGAVVTKERLMATVWPDTVVVEKVLTRAISELRKALGDEARAPRFIETLPRVGYRLMAPVQFPYSGDSVPTATRARPRPQAVADHRRVPAWGVALLGAAVVLGGLAFWQMLRPPTERYLGAARPLTTEPGHEQQPALAPDGQRVAYIAADPETWSRDLFVKQPGMEKPLRLTDDPGGEVNPVWSRDGQEILFLRYGRGGCTGFFSVPALGGTERRLADCLPQTLPAFDGSPDGQTLAVSVVDPLLQRPRLALLTLADGTLHWLPPPPTTAFADWDPVFSPDGQHLAFTRAQTQRTQDVYLLHLATETSRRLTADYRDLKSYTWLPEGQHLIFSSDRSGSYALWQLGIDGKNLHPLTPGRWNLKEPSFAASGHLAYERWRYDTNIWQTDLTEAARPDAALLTSTRWDQEPSFSPDGTRLAFVSNRSGPYELWTSQADGSDLRQITQLDGPVVSAPRWSPDGTHLAFVSYPNGFGEIHLIDAEGGPPRSLTPGTEHDHQFPAWSRDGQTLYFSSNRSGSWQIWQQSVLGSAPTQLTTDGGGRALPSTDGQTLYFSRRDTTGLWQLPVTGGTATLVTDALQPFDGGNWDLAGGLLFYVQRTDRNEATVQRHDLRTGTTTRVATLARNLMWNQANLAVSPDGSILLHVQVDDNESDLMWADVE